VSTAPVERRRRLQGWQVLSGIALVGVLGAVGTLVYQLMVRPPAPEASKASETKDGTTDSPPPQNPDPTVAGGAGGTHDAGKGEVKKPSEPERPPAPDGEESTSSTTSDPPVEDEPTPPTEDDGATKAQPSKKKPKPRQIEEKLKRLASSGDTVGLASQCAKVDSTDDLYVRYCKG
jgi:hypothetical protein